MEKRSLTNKELTEAETLAWEERMRAAGITVEEPEPGTATITLLNKRATEDTTGDEQRLDDDGSGTVE